MSLPLTGRVSIVTGSSRGIGAAIVKRLASQGANVVINYVASAAVAQSIADEINAKGAGKAITVQADVGSLAGNQKLVDAALGQFGRIDSLVLNAGYLEYALLKDVTEQEYAKHFDTNVKGPLFLTQAAAPHLKPGSKVVLFSTSLTHASTIPPNYLLYAATKGAVEQINRVLAKDLGARGINVNTVAPGPIDTDLFRHGKTEQQIAFFESIHPQKRLGQAEEVSNVVQFLVSDEASWINGQTIRVNGGFAV
ncbi:NAD(P)-binding protein [Dichomitus squalens]|uniref:NAD(P)-binding protein n=1 Tax=Dichomitus squalens TaxID=114155 RepID=A0A4Q9M9C2_9APHY|nr:NAD(P)-binding protein [Dichomitus squalens]TBU39407.1 NAD(P)-binding protein [Dichomitus squalens]TBU51671.1 NAD(P)-binding protein [Dichomitus squalens]